MTDDTVRQAVVQRIKALDGMAPGELLPMINFSLRKQLPEGMSETELVKLLTEPDVNSSVKTQFRIQLSRWDAVDDASWTSYDGNPTAPNTVERRRLIYDLLELTEDAHQPLEAEYPRDLAGAIVISSEQPWDPWYTEERRRQHSFYWDSYSRVLAEKLPAEAVAKLDGATTKVVERLTDPTRSAPYQSKGLVVGYVQSGKTANFAGVIAKAVDAGYRLIIVLTGTVEILRSQTQRRLDMELVGEENIIGGKDRDNPDAMSRVDYYREGDQDWFEGKFLKHGINPVDHNNVPTVLRLTSPTGDYKSLRAGLSALDFRQGNELIEKSKPLYDPANLFRTDVRLAVVKKQSSRLRQLVSDLNDLHANLGEIPALIIDDEADQASVNTVNPRKKGKPTPEERERSAINKRIAELMSKLKRCQYIGYTATPFANVFIDPDDSEDVFPRDFIVNLDRPDGYMGGTDFHDLQREYDEQQKTPASSNEEAFIRDLLADSSTPAKRREELQEALDAFVLSGAIKLHRQSRMNTDFRHHTMLVHESVKQDEHAALAGEIRTLWAQSGYSTPTGLARLRELWENDYRSVCVARADGSPVPTSFDELKSCIGAAVDKVSQGTTPVLVVNGSKEKDYEQQELDFQASEVWKILVGGAKLSRGFTIEGLTVSYYTRRTQQADTLMQMGRWFGFRHGYRDLVRLYIGRNVPGPRNTVVDLYEAFEGVVRDEEDFRAELRQYSHLDENGRPMVRPQDVPPMVFQELPWLKPTQTNKMYNAELAYQGAGAKVQDFSMQPDRGTGDHNRGNFAAVQPLLDALTKLGEFEYRDTAGSVRSFTARYGVLPADIVADALEQFAWTPNWSFAPHLAFLRRAANEGLLTDWAVVLPQLSGSVQRHVEEHASPLPIIQRKRRGDRPGFSGSSFRQRGALEHIADSPKKEGGPLAEALRTGMRGGLLLNFAADTAEGSVPSELPSKVDPRDIATLFSYALPLNAAPKGRIGFTVRRKNAGAIIDRASKAPVEPGDIGLPR